MKIALGFGCDRGTPAATIAQCINEALAACGATLADVQGRAASTSRPMKLGYYRSFKKTAGPAPFTRPRHLLRVTCQIPQKPSSRTPARRQFPKPAALLAASADQSHLILEKDKLRGPDGRNATVSIARIAHERPNTYA